MNDSLLDLPPILLDEIAALDGNIPTLIKVIEMLPHDSEPYFYFRTLLSQYIKALEENMRLRIKLHEMSDDQS